jgi:3-oxoacyl-[acyl-carrier-protein] synthase-3
MVRESNIGIVGLGSYVPGESLGVEEFFSGNGTAVDKAPLFAPPRKRHHVSRDERAGEMVVRAARPMLERLGVDPAEGVDLIITNTLLPDDLITGCGSEVADLLGCRPRKVIDLHNGGCASFAFMLDLAQTIVASGAAQTALLSNTQNLTGQLFTQPGHRQTSQAAMSGDGCGVAYLAAGAGSPLLGVATLNEPSCWSDMYVDVDGRKYWEAGESEVMISFDREKRKQIVERGNQLVPKAVLDVCAQLDMSPSDIDVLITNQPNRLYLRHWRKALGIEPDRHINTFDEYGNLYGAGLSMTLEHAVRTGAVQDGDLVVLAGFAHAGDLAAAAAVRWSSAAHD